MFAETSLWIFRLTFARFDIHRSKNPQEVKCNFLMISVNMLTLDCEARSYASTKGKRNWYSGINKREQLYTTIIARITLNVLHELNVHIESIQTQYILTIKSDGLMIWGVTIIPSSSSVIEVNCLCAWTIMCITDSCPRLLNNILMRIQFIIL